jgi:hypothetical protein
MSMIRQAAGPASFLAGLIRVKRQPGRPALVSLVSKRAGGADA